MTGSKLQRNIDDSVSFSLVMFVEKTNQKIEEELATYCHAPFAATNTLYCIIGAGS